MADDRIQFEADDELLSAYLDEELTAAERARVEARLAADPAARELLGQLRGVSEAVRRLPAEGVGEDLRESILERAERAVLTGMPLDDAKTRGGEETSPVANETRPRGGMTIGRTPRAWIWAGLAVAAALLLMVYGPEAERDERLPPLAQRDVARDLERRGELEMRALEEPDAMVAEPDAAPPADRIATAPPLPAAPAALPEMVAARDDPAADERAADDAVFDELAAAADEEDVLVVHVNVTPAAYRNREFDRLLVTNGIVLESPAEMSVASGLAASPAAPAAGGRGRVAGEPAGRAAAVDVVLVEAPTSQIEEFLGTLSRDVTNFAAVEIDKTRGRDDAPARQQAVERNWMQYNRGSVPLEQKQQVPRRVGLQLYTVPEGRAAEGAPPAAALSKGELRGGYGRGEEQQARARRVQPLDVADGVEFADLYGYGVELRRERDVASRGAAGVAVRQPEDGRREPSTPPVADETLQVLFVLSPEPAGASSAEAADSPE